MIVQNSGSSQCGSVAPRVFVESVFTFLLQVRRKDPEMILLSFHPDKIQHKYDVKAYICLITYVLS